MVDETTLRIKLGLSPVSAQLLNQLLDQQVVTAGDNEDAHRVAMHRLRANLEPHGITIQSRRTLGYWLADGDKAKIMEMCNGNVAVGDE